MSDKPTRTGFLDRWSSRKQQVEQEKQSAVPDSLSAREGHPLPPEDFSESSDVSPEPVSAGSLDTAAKATSLESVDTPLLTDADMPSIESLTSDSDISVFFSDGVSAALKRAALRHVFMQPKYNIRDGLNDYDGDYTNFEPLGDTITSDMKWHTARKERNRLEAEALEREALGESPLEQQIEEQDESEQSSPDSETADSQAQDEAPHKSGAEAEEPQDATEALSMDDSEQGEPKAENHHDSELRTDKKQIQEKVQYVVGGSTIHADSQPVQSSDVKEASDEETAHDKREDSPELKLVRFNSKTDAKDTLE